MAHAVFVKNARKARPEHGISIGDSYYWWSFRNVSGGGSGRFFSKTQPKRSQLTRSEFYSTLYTLEDQASELKAEGYESVGDFEGDATNIRDELEQLKSDTEEKLEAMPDGLKEGDTGQLLQERIDNVEQLISEFDSLEFSEPEEETTAQDSKEAGTNPQDTKTENDIKTNEKAERIKARIEEIIEEIQGFNWSF